MSSFNIKMVRAAAPALDRAYQRLEEGGYREATDAMTLKFVQDSVIMRFDTIDMMEIAGGVFVEEMNRNEGWGGNTIYDTGNATTGKPIGYRFTHPMFLSRVGTEVRDRPALWRIEGPMPDGRVPLDARQVERLTAEVAACARDLFTQRALEEGNDVPPPPPVVQGDPLETSYHRDAAEWNDEPVNAPLPRRQPPPTPDHMIPVQPLQMFQVGRNGQREEETNRAE